MMEKVLHAVKFIIAASIILSLGACRKDSTDPKDRPDQTIVDPPPVVYATKPQVDIPWPGLAQSAWAMFAHDPQHTGRSPFRGPQQGAVDAMFNANDIVYSTPVIGTDGSVYFAAHNQNFFSLTPSFAQRWQSIEGGGKGTALIGQDGTVYFRGSLKEQGSSRDRYVLAFDPAGGLKWKYRVMDSPPSSASDGMVISKDGNILYATGGALYALRTNGELVWKFTPPDTNQILRYDPALSPDGRMIIAVSEYYLFAIDTSGHLQWTYEVNHPSCPSIDNDGNIYIAGAAITSLSPTGQVRWSTPLTYGNPIYAPPVIGRDGTIYVPGFRLQAFDYEGKLKWNYDYKTEFPSGSTPAIDIDGTIYVGQCTKRGPADTVNFVAIKPDGTLKFSVSLPVLDGTHVPDVDSGPSISGDGKIYVGADTPRGFFVYKIR